MPHSVVQAQRIARFATELVSAAFAFTGWPRIVLTRARVHPANLLNIGRLDEQTMQQQAQAQSIALSAREVAQVLREVALEVRLLRMLSNPTQNGCTLIEVEGWLITLCHDGDRHDGCEACASPDGRVGNFASWPRYGTDPISLLSTWEHQQLERLLRAARALLAVSVTGRLR